MTSVAVILAHQGGWDEILLVAGPLAVFAGVIHLANKRANAKLAAAAAAEDGTAKDETAKDETADVEAESAAAERAHD